MLNKASNHTVILMVSRYPGLKPYHRLYGPLNDGPRSLEHIRYRHQDRPKLTFMMDYDHETFYFTDADGITDRIELIPPSFENARETFINLSRTLESGSNCVVFLGAHAQFDEVTQRHGIVLSGNRGYLYGHDLLKWCKPALKRGVNFTLVVDTCEAEAVFSGVLPHAYESPANFPTSAAGPPANSGGNFIVIAAAKKDQAAKSINRPPFFHDLPLRSRGRLHAHITDYLTSHPPSLQGPSNVGPLLDFITTKCAEEEEEMERTADDERSRGATEDSGPQVPLIMAWKELLGSITLQYRD